MHNQADTRQPFLNHIQELRRRLLWPVLWLVLGSIAGYLGRNSLIQILQQPLGQPLFYNSPSGGFEFSMQVSLLIGLVIAVPAVLYNLFRFIEPALPVKIKHRQLFGLISLSFGLAILGLAFAYLVVLPMSLHFFGGFSRAEIKPLISAKDYLSFVQLCLATFAIMFQLPLILLFIDRIRPFPPKSLKRYRKHVIVGSLVLAALLPFSYDPITQFVIALPVIGLYELSMAFIWANHYRHRKPRQAAAVAAADLEPVIVAETSPAPVAVISSPAALSLPPRPGRPMDIFVSRPHITGTRSNYLDLRPAPRLEPARVFSNPKMSMKWL